MQDVIDPGFDRIESDRERREAWMQAVSPVVVPSLEGDGAIPKLARFHSWRMGGLVLNEIRASAQTVERTRYQIAGQGIDHVLVRLFSSGKTAIMTGADDRPIRIGSVGLFDLSQTSRSRSAGMSGLNVIVPRRFMDRGLGGIDDLHQSIVSPRGRPLVRLLADHLRNAHACIGQVEGTRRRFLADGTVAILNAALTPATDSAHDGPRVRSIEIRQFIEANLGRSDLGVDAVCARFGLSRTPVYESFEADGGVMTYIRNRRLAWAMRILSGVEGGPARRVSEIAYSCGYDNLKAFSKAFKARYGVVPRDVDTTFMDETRWETGAAMLSWILEL